MPGLAPPAGPAPAKPRVNDGLLARFERAVLPPMARAMPRWVTPDTLTALSLASAAVGGTAYYLAAQDLDWLWLASVCLVLHWFGDSLDGTLARVRDIRRERYGFYVDHQADAVSVLLLFTGLGLGGLMHVYAAMLLLAGVLLLMVLVHLVTVARGVFKISFGHVGPTEGRAALIAGNTLVWALGNPTVDVLGQPVGLFSAMGWLGAVAVLTLYVVFSLVERGRLARLDPTPEPGRGPVASDGSSRGVAAPAGSR